MIQLIQKFNWFNKKKFKWKDDSDRWFRRKENRFFCMIQNVIFNELMNECSYYILYCKSGQRKRERKKDH